MLIIPTGTIRKPITAKRLMRLRKKSDRWGLAGAGVLYYCPSDHTVLLLLRSKRVEDSGLWGIPGGSVKDEEGEQYVGEDVEAPEYSEDELRDSADSEVQEEIGHIPKHEKEEGSHTTVNNNFPYTTFLRVVNPQQKGMISRNIQLNWESDRYEWFRVDFLPENVHPGVIAAIDNLIAVEQ